jgi:hypothetical protein
MRQLDGDYDPIAPNTGMSSTKITLTTGFGSFLWRALTDGLPLGGQSQV